MADVSRGVALLPLEAWILYLFVVWHIPAANMRPSWILHVFILVLFGVYGKIDFDHPVFSMLKYSASDLFQFKHSAPPATCVLDTLRSLHLHRPKYVN